MSALGGRDTTAKLWDVATRQPIATLTGHREELSGAAFSPDGTRIITASWDNMVRLWDISGLPRGNLFQIACAWLPDHDLIGIAKAGLRGRPAAA
jgi:WD40 repeat protein